jgi:hypothetical protein
VKQVHWLLSYPNRHLGQPFLQGNFAPQFSEIFTKHLSLVTAAGTAATADTAGLPAKPSAAAASKAAAPAGGSSNGVHHVAAAAANGYANGHANGHANGQLAADGDDVKQQRDTVPNPGSSSPSSSSSSSKLYGSLDSLPSGLDGVFLRVGPNPLLKPLGGYHW